MAPITVARDLLHERAMRRALPSLAMASLVFVGRASLAAEPELPPRLVLRAGIGGYVSIPRPEFTPLGPEVMLGATVRIWRFMSLDLEGSAIFGPQGNDAGGIPASIEGRAGLEAAFPIRAAKAWLVLRTTVGLLYYIDAGTDGSERFSIPGRAITARLTAGIRWPLASHFGLGVELGLSAGQLTTALVMFGESSAGSSSFLVAFDLAAVAYFPFL